jgi:hypothetical protein
MPKWAKEFRMNSTQSLMRLKLDLKKCKRITARLVGRFFIFGYHRTNEILPPHTVGVGASTTRSDEILSVASPDTKCHSGTKRSAEIESR